MKRPAIFSIDALSQTHGRAMTKTTAEEQQQRTNKRVRRTHKDKKIEKNYQEVTPWSLFLDDNSDSNNSGSSIVEYDHNQEDYALSSMEDSNTWALELQDLLDFPEEHENVTDAFDFWNPSSIAAPSNRTTTPTDDRLPVGRPLSGKPLVFCQDLGQVQPICLQL